MVRTGRPHCYKCVALQRPHHHGCFGLEGQPGLSGPGQHYGFGVDFTFGP